MSRKRRETSEEEKTLFSETVGGGTPAARHGPRKSVETATPKQRAKPQAASATRGLDGRTAERLRRGQLDPDARLDLHGMTEAVAHRTLLTFLKSAHRQGARLVLVVTGKGARSADAAFDLEFGGRTRGVLNAMTPRWLAEPEFAPFVVEVRAAHRRHGGSGALYVYLRKGAR